jgi:nucleoside-diphosphate-sugar epimerase
MKTLITGATGHLGVNLVRELVKQGEDIKVFIHNTKGSAVLKGLEIEQVEGDIRDISSIKKALQGCDKVYHLAAFVSIRSGDRSKLFDINVLGTRRLMVAAREAGVQKVVHCSSLGAVGTNPNGPSDEQWSVSPYEETTDYEISKTFAESEVYKEIAKGLPAVIVNPSGIVGPWDYRPSLLGKTIVEYANKKMKAYVNGAFDFVPVRDVVSGHILAMQKGKTGERYLLTGEEVSIKTTLEWLEELTGVSMPKICIPSGLMQSIALVKDTLEKRFFPNNYPRFNYHSIRLLKSGKYGDNTKAVAELGLKPSSVKQAYREAVDWFREHDYIPKMKM